MDRKAAKKEKDPYYILSRPFVLFPHFSAVKIHFIMFSKSGFGHFSILGGKKLTNFTEENQTGRVFAP